MSSPDQLRPEEFLDALRVTAEVLEDHASALDSLSGIEEDLSDAAVQSEPGVGTEMALILLSAVNSAAGARDYSTLSSALARGAHEASVSRNGRLLAEVIDGLTEVLANADLLDAQRFSFALESAAERVSPTDDGKHAGELRAVLAEAADDALSAADRGATLGETIVSAADAGLEELERGPVVNAGLAERGVVDASAAGLLLILDALAAVVNGTSVPTAPAMASGRSAPPVVEIRVACHLELSDPQVISSGRLRGELERLCRIDRMNHSSTAITGDSASGLVFLDLRTYDAGVLIESLLEFGGLSGLRVMVESDREPESTQL